MASNYHYHQCHCHPTPPTPTTPTYYYHSTLPIPTPTTTTCYCTTTHYTPPPPPQSDPLISSHHHHNHHHAPPQNHNNYHAPPQNQLYHQQQNIEQNPPLNPTVSSLIHRITALETTLRRRNNQSQRSSSLRDTAARTIQTHFRAFLVHRSVTLRHLKDLAYIKSALNHLKSSVSNKTHFDSYFISQESMNLLIKLDSIQGSDPMIRDGKRLISRELVRFIDLIDQISVKNVRISKIRASSSRVFGDNERKLAENLRKRINKIRVSSVPKTEEDEVEISLTRGVSQIRNTKSQPKVKKNVSFNENGNVYRLIKRGRSLVLSDGSDSSNGDDEEVEEIGVSSKETEVVEVEEDDDSSEMSGNEMDPRNNLNSRINLTTQKYQPKQEVDDDEDKEDDSFVFCAPLPAKMEYRVDSVNKKTTGKQ